MLSPPVELLCEDGPLLAFNKPAGLLTQGVPDGLPSLESLVKGWLKDRFQKPGNVYLGVPHRLDRPVSGVVIFSRNSKAAARLAEMFRERTVRKLYWAVTESTPTESTGELRDFLLKDAEAAHVTAVPEGTLAAKEARLKYRQLAALPHGVALVEIELITGRMHQIRVQFASRGWPIVGDMKYGARALFPGVISTTPHDAPIALHARSLQLKHPVRYDDLHLQAPLPPTWDQFILPPLG